MRNVIGLTLGFVLAITVMACSKDGRDSEPVRYSPYDVNLYALNKLSCDPLGGGDTGENPTAGIQATLYYLRSGQTPPQSVASYMSQGQRADQFLFFSQINVPTRMFNTGFPLMSGGLISKDDGTTLYEYFALRFLTTLQLAPDDEEGTYELALLSDDGAIWRIKNENGNYEEAVNNDGDHPTRMGCSSYRINMTRSTQRLMQLDYYQGPRYHIAVIPIWRKVGSGQTTDPLCGVSGNNYFFNPDNNSQPLHYNDLLARGWKPLKAANYKLPESVIFNPCQGGTNPVVTNFVVEDQIDGVVKATWKTDIPSTSQLRIVDLTTGAEQLTESDNILSTDHVVFAVALKSGHQYQFQGVSISESYGKVISSPVTMVLQ